MKLRSIATILTAFIVIPIVPAHAQFGGLIKKAKSVVTGDTATAKTDPPTSATATDLAVTSERLDAMLKGLTAQIPLYQQLAAERKRGKQLTDQRVQLQDANQMAISTYQARNNDWGTCFDAAVREAGQAHAGEMASKQMAMASDPQKMMTQMQEQQAANQKYAALLAAGDTAGANAVMAGMFKRMGIDLHADTVAAERKCGARPAKPAVLVQIEDLQKQEQAAEENQRALEKRAGEVGAGAAGISVQEFGLAREVQVLRMTRWLNSCRGGGGCGDRSLTPAENALFQQRRADVEKIVATEQQLEQILNAQT